MRAAHEEPEDHDREAEIVVVGIAHTEIALIDPLLFRRQVLRRTNDAGKDLAADGVLDRVAVDQHDGCLLSDEETGLIDIADYTASMMKLRDSPSGVRRHAHHERHGGVRELLPTISAVPKFMDRPRTYNAAHREPDKAPGLVQQHLDREGDVRRLAVQARSNHGFQLRAPILRPAVGVKLGHQIRRTNYLVDRTLSTLAKFSAEGDEMAGRGRETEGQECISDCLPTLNLVDLATTVRAYRSEDAVCAAQ